MSSKTPIEILLQDEYKTFLQENVSITDLRIIQAKPDLIHSGFHSRIQKSIDRYTQINNLFKSVDLDPDIHKISKKLV